MASGVYNAGALALNNGGIVWASDTIKVMLVGTATAYTFDPDHTSMTTPALSELSVTGYAAGFAGAGRATLGTKTLTSDTTNDRTVYDAADPSAWTLSTGGTVASAIVYKHLTSDAASTPIFFLDFTDVPTNGSTFTLQFAATGINYIQNG